MPTKKPRIYITVSPELDLALDRVAAASGRPRATLISEWMEMTIPHLHAWAEVMERAKQESPVEVMRLLLGASVSQFARAASAVDQAVQQQLGLILPGGHQANQGSSDAPD